MKVRNLGFINRLLAGRSSALVSKTHTQDTGTLKGLAGFLGDFTLFPALPVRRSHVCFPNVSACTIDGMLKDEISLF